MDKIVVTGSDENDIFVSDPNSGTLFFKHFRKHELRKHKLGNLDQSQKKKKR